MSSIEIEQAIARVKAGNVEDYRSVVVAFHPRVRSIVAGLCPPGVEADEISHGAFIEAYRRIDDSMAELQDQEHAFVGGSWLTWQPVQNPAAKSSRRMG